MIEWGGGGLSVGLILVCGGLNCKVGAMAILRFIFNETNSGNDR